MSTKNNRSPFCIFPNYRYCGPGCSGPGNPITMWMVAVKHMIDALKSTHNVTVTANSSNVFVQRLNLLREKVELPLLCIFI